MCKLSHFGLLFVCVDSTPGANHLTFLLGSFTVLNCQLKIMEPLFKIKYYGKEI